MSDVKRYGHIGYLVTATPHLMSLYSDMKVYVSADDFDELTHDFNTVARQKMEFSKERDQLKADNESLRADAELYQQIQIAAGSLPSDWEISLRIENGYAGIDLIDPYGTVVDLDSVDESLGESVASAVAFAIDHTISSPENP
jgi:hypothetical protein